MNGSLTATTVTFGFFIAARHTRRPMRPKPLMPPATAMVGAWAAAWGRVAAGRALPDVVNADAPEARRAAAVYFLRGYLG